MHTPIQMIKKSKAEEDARDHFINSSVDGKRMSPTGDVLFKRPDPGAPRRPGRPDGGILFKGLGGDNSKLG